MIDYEWILAIVFFIVVIILFALIPKPIERIVNNNGKTLIEIYQNKLGYFTVHDKLTRRKIRFRTFIDAQAYITHRLNRWSMHPDLNQ